MSNMVVATNPWNEPESLWAAAGVLASVLSMVVGPWIARWFQESRRRMLYSMPTTTPLNPAGYGLGVSHNGYQLTHPQIVEVRLICRGRHDIPSSAFDGGQPLRVDVGTMIVNVLRTESSPDKAPVPKWRTDGTSIMIYPSLIKKNQKLSFSLLVDGPQPELTCSPSLVDVDVDVDETAEERLTLAIRLLVIAASLGMGVMLITVPGFADKVMPIVPALKEMGWWPW
ncbi:hypothetical protein AB0J14_28945 [Micromonospora arborensis]|uniref:hypothetical protein n=1 Tax=Micromonospora arborensis TaxID=2116518 RepID=UPI003404AFCB